MGRMMVGEDGEDGAWGCVGFRCIRY